MTTEPDKTTEQEWRDLARRLFSTEAGTTEGPAPTENSANRVPREGSIPAPPHDDGDLAFVRALFDPNSP